MARPRVPATPAKPAKPPAAKPKPPAAKPITVKALEDEIKNTVTARMQERIAAAGGQMTAPVQQLIATEAAAAAQRSIQLAVAADAAEAVSNVTRGSLLNRFDDRVGLASAGLEHIVASDDVQQIMKRRAEMLAAKKKALETAGFSSDEAMEIILADIAARGH